MATHSRKSDAKTPQRTQGPISEDRNGPDLEFAERVRTLVKLEGSQSALARKANLSQSAFHRYLSGGDATRKALNALADAARVSLEWLATGRGPMHADEMAIPAPEDLTYLPLVSVRAGAGGGSEVYEERVVDALAFKTEWLRGQLRANPADLVVITVQGESMEPGISEGDIILVDRGAVSREMREGVYVLRVRNTLMVKRLQVLPGGRIRATSDNPAYQPFELNLNELGDELAIIGRVRWLGHHL